MMSGEIKGEYDIATIYDDLIWEIARVLPSYFKHDSTYVPSQNFNFEFVFQDMSFLQSLNIIDIDLSPESQLYGKVSPIKNQSYLNFNSEQFNIKGFTLHYPELFIESNGEDIFLELLYDHVHYLDGPKYFKENEFISVAKNDTINFDFTWSQGNNTRGEINLQSVFFSENELKVSSNGSRFTFLEKNWVISDSGMVSADSLDVTFKKCKNSLLILKV